MFMVSRKAQRRSHRARVGALIECALRKRQLEPLWMLSTCSAGSPSSPAAERARARARLSSLLYMGEPKRRRLVSEPISRQLRRAPDEARSPIAGELAEPAELASTTSADQTKLRARLECSRERSKVARTHGAACSHPLWLRWLTGRLIPVGSIHGGHFGLRSGG